MVLCITKGLAMPAVDKRRFAYGEAQQSVALSLVVLCQLLLGAPFGIAELTSRATVLTQASTRCP